jgi:hypothetical protein
MFNCTDGNFASFRGFVADEADAVLADAADADMLVLTVLLCAGMSSGNEIIMVNWCAGNVGGQRSTLPHFPSP